MFFVSCATVFHNICRCSVFSFLFVKMAVFFVFLRNIHSSIEILKIKILEYSYPPSKYFFVNKAFIRFFFVSPEDCAVPIWQNGTNRPNTTKPTTLSPLRSPVGDNRL